MSLEFDGKLIIEGGGSVSWAAVAGAPTTYMISVALSVDSGTFSNDFITNVQAQTLSGFLSAPLDVGETLEGSLNSGSSWADITNKVNGNSVIWTNATLVSGANIDINVRVRKGALSGPLLTQPYVLDTTPPTTTVSIDSLSDDTGASSSDFITNVAIQTVYGTLSAGLAAGEELLGSTNGGTTWYTITSKVSGTAIAWDGVTLVGNDSIKMKVIDLADNDGSTTTQVYVLDTTGPTKTISGIDISADTGNPSDFITSIAAQTIEAVLSASLTGGDILYGSVNAGSSWADVTSSVSGTAVNWVGATLLEGSSSIQFKVGDAAGNDGATALQTYTLDTDPPTTTISGIDISSDTGPSDTDFITNVAAQTITATLSASLVGGEILYGSTNAGSSWVDITSKASGTAISWDGASLAGVSSIKIKVSDVAGNDSPVTTQAYTLDTDPPTTTISNIDISADTGSSSTDFITNVAVQNITATLSVGLVGGETLYGSVNGGGTWSDITGSASGTAIIWIGATLSGSSTIQFKVQDNASNDGPVASQSYTLDTSNPTITISGIDISADTGTFDTDFITGTALQDITGALSTTLAGNDILYGSVNAGGSWTNVTSSVSGTVINWIGAILSGSSSIKFKVTNLAGNDGPVTTQAYTLDISNPTITISGLDISADTGDPSDFITSTALQNITATLSTSLAGGDILYGSINSGSSYTNITASVSGTAINWVGATLITGVQSIKLKVTDAAGNDGQVITQAYTLDLDIPSTTIGGIDISSDTGISASDFITATASQDITATLSIGLTGGQTLEGSVNAGSSWVDITGSIAGTTISWMGISLISGSSSIKFKVRSPGGNDGPIATQAYTLDTSESTSISGIDISVDDGTPGDFVTSEQTQDITGTLSLALTAGAILEGSVNAGSSWTDVTSFVSGTSINWTSVNLIAGTSSIKFRVTDLAGNEGPIATQAYTYNSYTAGDRALFSTGYGTDYITISSPGNATDFASVFGKRSGTGASNGQNSRAIWAKQYDTPDIWLFNIAVPGESSVSFGNMTVARDFGAAVSNGTSDRAIFMGGLVGIAQDVRNTIDYITISSLGNAASNGGILNEKLGFGGHTSNGVNDRAVLMGGQNTSYIYRNTIQWSTISTAASATGYGTLSMITGRNAATSTDTNDRATSAGGQSGGRYQQREYITISSGGASTTFGSLTAARNHHGAASNGTSGTAVIAGGMNPGATASMEQFSLLSNASASFFGNLAASGSNMNGVWGVDDAQG